MTDTYRIRSAETWAQARDDYLAGLGAEAVCRRHDLGLSAFRRRARKHGWRRMDHDDPAPGEADLSIYDDINADDQVETARLRFVQALSHGKAAEAARWRRLWHELRAENDAFNAEFFSGMDRAEIAASLAALHQEQDDADAGCLLAEPAAGAQPASAAIEKVRDVHSNFPGAHSPPDGSTPLSRAERRRREREARRRGGAQSPNASTTPVALPPDTTSPPAMA